MKKTVSIISLILLAAKLFAQADTSFTDTIKWVYKDLEIKTTYAVGMTEAVTKEGRSVYKLDGNEISAEEYNKYNNSYKNIENCKPCILKSYDKNDKLISKAIQYTDCPVGFSILYYPSGRPKIVGHYKENTTGNWVNIFDKGYCREDGRWTYYSESGKILYSEYWKDGNFIKQVPEQPKTEIWKVNLTLDGEPADKQILTLEQVKELKITPQFKNHHSEGTNLTIKFQVGAIGHKEITEIYTITDFNTIDIKKMLSGADISSTDNTTFNLMVFNNGKDIANFWLKVKH